MPAVLSKPAPHKQAAAFIAAKPIIARQAFDRLLPDLKARAMVITGVENANVVQAVRDRIAELPLGADWDTAKQDIAAKLSPWLDGPKAESGQLSAESQSAAERRAELLLRTHGFESYAAAAEEVGDRQRAAFPFCQYLTSDDDHVRDSHAALNGIVLPADDPFWETHTGPWEWGCRCSKAWLTRGDVADIEQADAGKKPEERRVISGARLQALSEGRLITASPGGVPQIVNVAPSGTFTFNPKTLHMSAAELKPRYDVETWGVFEKWAGEQKLDDGRNLLEWLNGKGERLEARGESPAPISDLPSPISAAAPAAFAEAERAAMRTAVYQKEEAIGGNHINAVAKLTNGRTVVFKPGAGETTKQYRRGVVPGTQYKREIAASVIDEHLGLGLVPPTTLLVRNGVEGSAQLFKDGFRPAAAYKNAEMYAALRNLPMRTKQDWQLFDDLVAHLDRHGNNYMLRVVGDKTELALIDNGLSLATVAQRKMYTGLFMEGAPIDAVNLARLRDFIAREKEISAQLTPYLEPAAVKLVFERARILLQRGTYGHAHP